VSRRSAEAHARIVAGDRFGRRRPRFGARPATGWRRSLAGGWAEIARWPGAPPTTRRRARPPLGPPPTSRAWHAAEAARQTLLIPARGGRAAASPRHGRAVFPGPRGDCDLETRRSSVCRAPRRRDASSGTGCARHFAWAAERVPLYTERFARPRRPATSAIWPRLPFTCKSDLREHYPFRGSSPSPRRPSWARHPTRRPAPRASRPSSATRRAISTCGAR